MKHLTLKALFISAVAALSMNVQAAESVYDQCIADGNMVIKLGKEQGAKAAKAYQQKTTVAQCFAELDKLAQAPDIEKRAGSKVAVETHNPSYYMTGAEKLQWSKLFSAIDAKQYRGVEYLMGVYYRKQH
ncbi:MAG: hypothetical protein IE914_04730 [Thiotrichales bacterium]|nr:hypothetical protein [Thiotrichales bacterium]